MHEDPVPDCSNVRIRPIEASNIADLIRLGAEANLSPWTAEHYLAEMRNPNAILLRLISHANETIGFVVGRVVMGGVIESVVDAEIYNIMVSGHARKRGLGQLLLDRFLERCREAQVANIWLEVRESNAPAINFYVKNGFTRVQARPNFYRDPVEDALLMCLATGVYPSSGPIATLPE